MSIEKHHDILIIGGGAAGLATAIQVGELAGASEPALSITIIDAAPVLGAKILVSGGGRCNVTHRSISAKDFASQSGKAATAFIRNIFKQYGLKKTLAWLDDLGIELKEESTGKLFPVSDQAKTVVNALKRRCHALGVRIVQPARVTAIERQQEGFKLTLEIKGEFSKRDVFCRQLVMATGGKSLPKTGSTGQGWQLVSGLGHTITSTFPALVPLTLKQHFFHGELSGIAVKAQLSTYVDEQLLDQREGEMLFTHFGLSGPLPMDASRYYTIHEDRKVVMKCNFLSLHPEHIDAWLSDCLDRHAKSAMKKIMLELPEKLPERLQLALLEHAGISPILIASQLSRDKRKRLGQALTQLILPLTGTRGWNAAEVTTGGVPLDEVHPKTMGSKKCDSLFLVGEILDCDGRIGGFNFQWAWSTAAVAAKGMIRQLDEMAGQEGQD